jgi:uncharacterized protein (DUF1810 family)
MHLGGTVVADEFDLDRFVAAQDRDRTYERALAELNHGAKQTHWMWFVFPQIAGLGQSANSQLYAISSLDEARAYLHHPVLGPRFMECTRVVAALDGTARSIFGGIDEQKLRSSMTLFARAAPEEAVFTQVLDRFFDGHADTATVLAISSPPG